LREASVLIAVFGGLVDPFFGAPSVRPGSVPSFLAEPVTGRIGVIPWSMFMLLLSGIAQLLGLVIERRR